MDGSAAIERNRAALVRIAASLIAMAAAGPHPEVRAGGEPRRTLPRHLWLAILRLLRPAEAAARRLIIAAARGIVPPPALRGRGTAPRVRRKAGPRTGSGGGGGVVQSQPCPARIALPLFDRLRRVGPRPRPSRDLPRICVPGWTARLPVPIRLAPSPDDPVSAARLALRLGALLRALDDLPGQARRFARLKARLDAEGAQMRNGHASGRFRRIAPLRGGPPPGGRLARYDSTFRHAAARRRRGHIREIDEILAHAHDLAVDALDRPDTS